MDLKKQHEQAGNDPESWRWSADSLLFAAAVLCEQRKRIDGLRAAEQSADDSMHGWRLHPVALMLMGIAVECLLKAVWLKRGNALVKDGKYIRVPGSGNHDLVQLARMVQFTLSDIEKDVLRRLTHFIEYGGRYPIPTAAEKLGPIASPRGGRAVPTHWASTDQPVFDAVVARIKQHLDETASR